MSDRNELAKLYAKRKIICIGKQLPVDQRAKIEIQQLCMDDMGLFEMDKNASLDEKKNQTIMLISKSIDAKPDDVKLLAVAYMEELVDEIMKVNDIADDDKIDQMKKSLRDNMQ